MVHYCLIIQIKFTCSDCGSQLRSKLSKQGILINGVGGTHVEVLWSSTTAAVKNPQKSLQILLQNPSEILNAKRFVPNRFEEYFCQEKLLLIFCLFFCSLFLSFYSCNCYGNEAGIISLFKLFIVRRLLMCIASVPSRAVSEKKNMASKCWLFGVLLFFIRPFTSFSEKFENHHEYCVVGAGPGGLSNYSIWSYDNLLTKN